MYAKHCKNHWLYLLIVAIAAMLLFLQACNFSGSASNSAPKLSGPEHVIAYPTIPPEQNCHFSCPKELVPNSCTLQGVVTLFGPPDKVHNLIFYAADGSSNLGLEFVYPSRGMNIKVYDESYNIKENPRRDLTVDDYECYVPGTLAAYLNRVREDASGQNRIKDYKDWAGFQK